MVVARKVGKFEERNIVRPFEDAGEKKHLSKAILIRWTGVENAEAGVTRVTDCGFEGCHDECAVVAAIFMVWVQGPKKVVDLFAGKRREPRAHQRFGGGGFAFAAVKRGAARFVGLS